MLILIDMTHEQPPQPELTPDQIEIANYFLEACGLSDVAGKTLEMMGQSGTVLYGLGRCAEYLMDSTPEDIRAMVIAKLEAQEQTS